MPPQDTPSTDMNLVSYRLKEIESSLEKNLEKLSNKIDLFLEQLNRTTVAQSETKVKVERLETEVERLSKVDDEVRNELTGIKVSVAERLSWGAAGGAIAAAVVKLSETL